MTIRLAPRNVFLYLQLLFVTYGFYLAKLIWEWKTTGIFWLLGYIFGLYFFTFIVYFAHSCFVYWLDTRTALREFPYFRSYRRTCQSLAVGGGSLTIVLMLYYSALPSECAHYAIYGSSFWTLGNAWAIITLLDPPVNV